MASYCQGHPVVPRWPPGTGEPFSYSRHGLPDPKLLTASKGPNTHRLHPPQLWATAKRAGGA